MQAASSNGAMGLFMVDRGEQRRGRDYFPSSTWLATLGKGGVRIAGQRGGSEGEEGRGGARGDLCHRIHVGGTTHLRLRNCKRLAGTAFVLGTSNAEGPRWAETEIPDISVFTAPLSSHGKRSFRHRIFIFGLTRSRRSDISRPAYHTDFPLPP